MRVYQDFECQFRGEQLGGLESLADGVGVAESVQAMAVRALVLLIELTQGTGYSGARRKCSGCDGPMKFEKLPAAAVAEQFRED